MRYISFSHEGSWKQKADVYCILPNLASRNHPASETSPAHHAHHPIVPHCSEIRITVGKDGLLGDSHYRLSNLLGFSCAALSWFSLISHWSDGRGRIDAFLLSLFQH
jgi:hypothetical protein